MWRVKTNQEPEVEPLSSSAPLWAHCRGKVRGREVFLRQGAVERTGGVLVL